MKVLVISASFPPMHSGGADYALRLCQELSESGLEIGVVTSRIPDVVTDKRFPVYPIMQHWSWSEWPRLIRLIRRFQPDVINLHFAGLLYHNQPMITFAPALFKRILPGVRVVTHMEHMFGIQRNPPSRVKRVLGKLRVSWRLMAQAVGLKASDYEFGAILRDSDRIIVLSDAHRITLERHLSGVGAKCDLIPPPPIIRMADADAAARRRGREQLGIALDDVVLVYYGYIDPWKGLETLLHAFATLKRNRPETPLKLVFIGGINEVALKTCKRPAYGQELIALAQSLGISESLVWTGYYPTDSDIASCYLRAADVAVLPYQSGVYLNNSSFSAVAAHGLPVVTTRGDLLESAFLDGENLLLAEAQDVQSLYQAIKSILEDAPLREKLSQGALRLASEWFCWQRAITRTVAIFEGSFARES